MYKDYEGILGLRLAHREHGRITHLYSAYLPPENSKYGRESNSFFYELLMELYKYDDVDEFVLVGDLNARIGEDTETCYMDKIPPRVPIEKFKNNHGKAFIEFLTDSKCCIVNSRKGKDDFTYMSTRGKSVVDYVYIPHDNFETIENFQVNQYNDVIDKLSCHQLLEGGGRVPDHGIISFEIRSIGFDPDLDMDLSLRSKSYLPSRTNITHRPTAIRYIEEGVMGRPAVRELLIKTIESIEKIRNHQKELDNTYNALIKQFSKLMEEPKAEWPGRHKSTPFKAYWCKELSDSWKLMKGKQTAFKKCNGNRTVRMLKRAEYKEAMHAFDKLLRKKK